MNDKDRPMPPLIAFAGALGGLAVVRWAYKTAVRINRELEEARLARVAEAQTGDIPTLRERFGEKVLTPVIAPASGMLSGLLGRRSPGAGALAALDGIGGLPDDLISALETRAIWAKFGF